MTAKIKMRCPRCKKQSFTLSERLETANCWHVSDGGVSEMFPPDGFPAQLGFLAECICGHHWRPRYWSAAKIIEASECP